MFVYRLFAGRISGARSQSVRQVEQLDNDQSNQNQLQHNTVHSTRPYAANIHTYHGLRGSASPVLTATGFVNGRGQFSTPHRIHTP